MNRRKVKEKTILMLLFSSSRLRTSFRIQRDLGESPKDVFLFIIFPLGKNNGKK